MKTVRDEVQEALGCSALWPRYTPAEQADILKEVAAVHSAPTIHQHRFSHLAQALEDAGFFSRMLIEQP